MTTERQVQIIFSSKDKFGSEFGYQELPINLNEAVQLLEGNLTLEQYLGDRKPSIETIKNLLLDREVESLDISIQFTPVDREKPLDLVLNYLEYCMVAKVSVLIEDNISYTTLESLYALRNLVDEYIGQKRTDKNK